MSVSEFDPKASAITMTEPAVKHFAKAIEKAEGTMLRLATKISGCNGYSYLLDIVGAAEDSDELITLNDQITLAVADDAIGLLRGTEIDYVQEGLNHTVKFNNPNVSALCGCGESFSV